MSTPLGSQVAASLPPEGFPILQMSSYAKASSFAPSNRGSFRIILGTSGTNDPRLFGSDLHFLVAGDGFLDAQKPTAWLGQEMRG